MDVKTQLVKVHNNDNVAVATCPIVAGTYIAEYDITASQDIPAGHKVALVTLSDGGDIVKYGFSIGAATSQINAGEHVHSHNAKTKLKGTEQYVYAPSNTASKQNHLTSGLQFMGYRRENGKVGIRNEVWI
ncbi:MAG: SAF domain-containing protein, partial [Pseudomonadota bacterium]|nr:SAF domain-containing protein [Pseudomonadota bacterium]